MKNILRKTTYFSLALFLTSLLVAGFKVQGGIPTFVVGGLVMTILSLILLPILNIIAIPFKMLSFGSFGLLINALILYILTVLVPGIEVKAFLFAGANYAGFTAPRVSVNTFFAYVISGVVFSLVTSFVNWIT